MPIVKYLDELHELDQLIQLFHICIIPKVDTQVNFSFNATVNPIPPWKIKITKTIFFQILPNINRKLRFVFTHFLQIAHVPKKLRI